jgi:hypothetical protein
MPIGQRRWAIAEGYIPGWSHGPAPQLISHETVCLLNATDDEAQVEITVFFSDREPVGPYRISVPPRRTRHVRFNDLSDPKPIPRAPILQASSNRVFRSSFSTRVSIRGRPSLPS